MRGEPHAASPTGAGQAVRAINAEGPVFRCGPATPPRQRGAAHPLSIRRFAAALLVFLAAAAGARVVALRLCIRLDRLDGWRKCFLIAAGKLTSMGFLAFFATAESIFTLISCLAHRIQSFLRRSRNSVRPQRTLLCLSELSLTSRDVKEWRGVCRPVAYAPGSDWHLTFARSHSSCRILPKNGTGLPETSAVPMSDSDIDRHVLRR